MPITTAQTFLMLQGPVSPFFPRLAARLEAAGHRVLRVNFSLGDWLFWRRPGAINYRGTLEAWPAFVTDLMARAEVTDLVLLGEQRPYHKVAVAAAEAGGVRVTVTDFGYLRPDWLVMERDGMGGRSRFPRRPAAIRALAAMFPPPEMGQRYGDDFAAQSRWDLAYQLANTLVRAPFAHYRSHHLANPVVVHITTGLRLLKGRRSHQAALRAIRAAQGAGEPYWVFPMQMELDYSIRAYSRFDGMEQPLREVIASFGRDAPEGRLFIKVHPLDSGMRDWARLIDSAAEAAGVAGRVSFLDGGDLASLLAGARGLITVNSTVGLMALQAGLPTLALGQAVYDVPGLTFQGAIKRFWTEAEAPEPELLADFVRAAAGALHVRGVYYKEPGLGAAVEAAALRLDSEVADAMAARIAQAEAVADDAERPELALSRRVG
jgi:capsular polysaccharide export protein